MEFLNIDIENVVLTKHRRYVATLFLSYLKNNSLLDIQSVLGTIHDKSIHLMVKYADNADIEKNNKFIQNSMKAIDCYYVNFINDKRASASKNNSNYILDIANKPQDFYKAYKKELLNGAFQLITKEMLMAETEDIIQNKVTMGYKSKKKVKL